MIRGGFLPVERPRVARPVPPPDGATLQSLTLRAVGELVADGVVVTLPALSVRCWQRWPARFALGTTPHPDSARVSAEVAKLVARGLLTRPEMSVLELTDAGRRALATEAP